MLVITHKSMGCSLKRERWKHWLCPKSLTTHYIVQYIPELATESDSEDEVPNLAKNLANWATDTKQTHKNLNELLTVLRKHGSHLPKDAWTPLSTHVQ